MTAQVGLLEEDTNKAGCFLRDFYSRRPPDRLVTQVLEQSGANTVNLSFAHLAREGLFGALLEEGILGCS